MSGFTSNPWRSTPSKYEKTVTDQQTIQQVIDSIPVMQGDLVSGITNPYVVKVPPGHEKEYYSLVKDANDSASDKRNVKVIFENNPDNMFEISLFNSCESLDKWNSNNGSLSLLEGVFSAGTKGIRSVTSDPGTPYIRYSNYESETYDWRAYQGILIDVKVNSDEITTLKFQIFDASGNIYSKASYSSSYEGAVFFSFFDEGGESATVIDFSAITKFYITAGREVGYTDDITVDFDNLRLVRTSPTNVAILRFDDCMNEHWETQKYVMDKGFRGCYAINNPMACLTSYVTKIGINNIKQMQANGNDIINHTVSMDNASLYDRAVNEYQYKAMRKFLNKFGLNKAGNVFINPGGASISYLEDCLLEHGAYSVYSEYGFPSGIAGIDTPSSTVQATAAAFLAQKRGGILQLMMHTISDASDYADFQDFLDWVEANFSKVIVFSDMIKMIPLGYNNKQPYSNTGSGAKVLRKETLTENAKVYFFDEVLHLDPGGSNRDVLPIDVFYAGQTLQILNTADAAETLTFDPLFTSSGAHDGAANADTLTDSGESWVTNQLVGRTINNTTDGSSGVITANDGTTITAVLSGGTDDDWDIGDTYTITPVGSNQDVEQDGLGLFVYDGEGWK
jgi:hypothetical protein